MSAPPSTYQKRAPRFQASLPATARLAGADHTCTAENLSRSGALLLGQFPETEEADLTLTIMRLELPCRIVFRQDERMGVVFENLSPEQATGVEGLLSRVVQGASLGALEALTTASSPAAVRTALQKISVPHRMGLALRAGPRERDWLRHDPDPAVLEALARNANAVPHEIKLLLRRADLLPSTLDQIAEDVRWSKDEEIQRMICCHPRVPLQTADRVVERMSELAIGRLLRQSGLEPGVRQKLMRKLALKHRG
jgi:PilZ domain-containing protein